MHDDSSVPPTQTGSTPPPEPSGTGRPAMQDSAADYSAAVAGIGLAAGPVPTWRQRILWLLAGTIVVVAGYGATAVVRRVQADQALHSIAKAAAITAVAPEPGSQDAAKAPLFPAPSAAATPETQAANGGLAASRAAPVQAQGVPSAPATPAEEKAGDGLDESREAGREGQAAKTVPAVMAPRAGEQGGVTQKPSARDRNGDTATRAVKRGDAAERKTASKRAKRDEGTFKRCPPLGKKGAVMCRWHICNGAAGKERACRPYLERKP